jgi:hypothetical protein
MSAYICSRADIRYLVGAAHYLASRPGMGQTFRWGWRDPLDWTPHIYRVTTSDPATRDSLGQLLLTENLRSVLHRYESKTIEELQAEVENGKPWPELPGGEHWPDGYLYGTHQDVPLDCWVKARIPHGNTYRVGFPIGQVAKALAHYEYQSCEHPGWPESAAQAFCHALRAELLRMVDGYEAAAWGAPEIPETATVISLSDLARGAGR